MMPDLIDPVCLPSCQDEVSAFQVAVLVSGPDCRAKEVRVRKRSLLTDREDEGVLVGLCVRQTEMWFVFDVADIAEPGKVWEYCGREKRSRNPKLHLVNRADAAFTRPGFDVVWLRLVGFCHMSSEFSDGGVPLEGNTGSRPGVFTDADFQKAAESFIDFLQRFVRAVHTAGLVEVACFYKGVHGCGDQSRDVRGVRAD